MQRVNLAASTPDPADAIVASLSPARRLEVASAFVAFAAAAGKAPDDLWPNRDRLEGEQG